MLTKQDEIKQENERFLRAFEYIRKSKGLTQAQFAEILGTNSSLISLYKSGKKRVGNDIINRLLMASSGVIYRRYITGQSDYMLLENVSDEQFRKDMEKEKNPDYELMHGIEDKSKYGSEEIPKWADTLIGIMSEQIKQNEALTRELRQSIADVNTLRDDLRRLIRGQYLPPINAGTYLAAAEKDHANNPNEIRTK